MCGIQTQQSKSMPNSMPNRCRNDAKLMQSMLYRCKLASTNLCHEHNLQSVPKRAQPPICAKTSTASILCQNEHNLQSVPKRAQPPICATSTTSNLCHEHNLQLSTFPSPPACSTSITFFFISMPAWFSLFLAHTPWLQNTNRRSSSMIAY